MSVCLIPLPETRPCTNVIRERASYEPLEDSANFAMALPQEVTGMFQSLMFQSLIRSPRPTNTASNAGVIEALHTLEALRDDFSIEPLICYRHYPRTTRNHRARNH